MKYVLILEDTKHGETRDYVKVFENKNEALCEFYKEISYFYKEYDYEDDEYSIEWSKDCFSGHLEGWYDLDHFEARIEEKEV